MLVMWRELFFMNLAMLSLPIKMIICFLDSPLVIIWMHSLAFGLPLTMLWIWSIFLVSRAGKFSLILITSDVLISCLEVCVCNFGDCLETLTSLMFLKYLEIWLTFFCDLNVWVRKSRIKMKRSLKVLKRNPEKYTEAED